MPAWDYLKDISFVGYHRHMTKPKRKNSANVRSSQDRQVLDEYLADSLEMPELTANADQFVAECGKRITAHLVKVLRQEILPRSTLLAQCVSLGEKNLKIEPIGLVVRNCGEEARRLVNQFAYSFHYNKQHTASFYSRVTKNLDYPVGNVL